METRQSWVLGPQNKDAAAIPLSKGGSMFLSEETALACVAAQG